MLCAVQAGGVPQAEALRTIELLGERVIPALRDTTAPQTAEDGRLGFRDGDLRVFLRESPTLTPRLAVRTLPLAFKPDRAAGLEALYRLDVRGRGGGRWWVRIADGRLELLDRDPGEKPDVRISVGARTWVRLVQGGHPRGLFGGLRVSGERDKAAAFEQLFFRCVRRPAARRLATRAPRS